MSVLEVHNITKRFPGTLALDNVSASFESGKVHALVGKNGSGKSTLMKIISGAYTADEGEIIYDGQTMKFKDPMSAAAQGNCNGLSGTQSCSDYVSNRKYSDGKNAKERQTN